MYNQKFLDYIYETEVDGAEVTLTQGFDSTIAICRLGMGNDNWITIAECHEGEEGFDLVNISGPAWKALKRAMEVTENENN